MDNSELFLMIGVFVILFPYIHLIIIWLFIEVMNMRKDTIKYHNS
jgi:hypothetical protein